MEKPTAFALGGWHLIDFQRAGSIAVLEHVRSSTFLFDQDAEPYAEIRATLHKLALSAQATHERIASLLNQPG